MSRSTLQLHTQTNYSIWVTRSLWIGEWWDILETDYSNYSLCSRREIQSRFLIMVWENVISDECGNMKWSFWRLMLHTSLTHEIQTCLVHPHTSKASVSWWPFNQLNCGSTPEVRVQSKDPALAQNSHPNLDSIKSVELTPKSTSLSHFHVFVGQILPPPVLGREIIMIFASFASFVDWLNLYPAYSTRPPVAILWFLALISTGDSGVHHYMFTHGLAMLDLHCCLCLLCLLHMSFAAPYWLGVQLDPSRGVGNGTVNGVRYFNCPAGCGKFVLCSVARAAPAPASPALCEVQALNVGQHWWHSQSDLQGSYTSTACLSPSWQASVATIHTFSWDRNAAVVEMWFAHLKCTVVHCHSVNTVLVLVSFWKWMVGVHAIVAGDSWHCLVCRYKSLIITLWSTLKS